MSDILILLASPRAGGTSDHVAGLFARGARSAGARCRTLALRDCHIEPCRGCQACGQPPHACALDSEPGDRAREIFERISRSPLLLWAAPIYFYGLPAPCKAFVDRAQRLWQAREQGKNSGGPPKSALIALVAGRARGPRLFQGALLSLKYFLAAQNRRIASTRLLRGLESPADLARTPAAGADILAWGRQWGEKLRRGKPAC